MKKDDVIQELQQLSPVLAGIGNQMPYQVPAGYFDNLEARLQAVFASEADKNGISGNETARNNVFKVPDGYFENLPQQVLQKVQPRARVFTLFERRTWMRLAAAVVVLLLMSTGVQYLWLQQTSTPAKDVVAAGLKIKTEQQFQKELEQVDAAALLNYLNSTASVTVAYQAEEMLQLAEVPDLPSETDLLDEDFLDAYLNDLEKTKTLN